MQAATRLRIAFLSLIAAFLVLVVLAVVGLMAARQPMLAAVAAVAGIAAVIGGGVTWLVARRDEEEPGMPEVIEPIKQPLAMAKVAPANLPRRPIRVQSMPVADLPPAYVDAVMKGVRARTSALKAEAEACERLLN